MIEGLPSVRFVCRRCQTPILPKTTTNYPASRRTGFAFHCHGVGALREFEDALLGAWDKEYRAGQPFKKIEVYTEDGRVLAPGVPKPDGKWNSPAGEEFESTATLAPNGTPIATWKPKVTGTFKEDNLSETIATHLSNELTRRKEEAIIDGLKSYGYYPATGIQTPDEAWDCWEKVPASIKGFITANVQKVADAFQAEYFKPLVKPPPDEFDFTPAIPFPLSSAVKLPNVAPTPPRKRDAAVPPPVAPPVEPRHVRRIKFAKE